MSDPYKEIPGLEIYSIHEIELEKDADIRIPSNILDACKMKRGKESAKWEINPRFPRIAFLLPYHGVMGSMVSKSGRVYMPRYIREWIGLREGDNKVGIQMHSDNKVYAYNFISVKKVIQDIPALREEAQENKKEAGDIMLTGQTGYYSGTLPDGSTTSWTGPSITAESALEFATKAIEEWQKHYNTLKGPDETGETVPGRGEDKKQPPVDGGFGNKP
jgi:bifunctional DNA-binding transcriptional regulator/antitoxin component of YhaV-PrlF toxin-antitoxin module